MNIVDDLLVLLAGGHKGPYRLIYKYFRSGTGFRESSKTAKDHTLRITLSRLKKKGLVENQNGVWKISQTGRAFAKKILQQKRARGNPRDVKRNMIIAFDIPETLRKKRRWLRAELIALQFEQLQQSVWFGPAPLPQEFIDELGASHLLRFIKFFKATEEDVI